MRRGFTLIEVMIAVALLALVGVQLMVQLSSSITAKERAEAVSGRYHMVRQAVARMVKEVSMAYISTHKNALERVVDTQFKGEKDKISFVAFGNIPRRADRPESDQREISYYIDTDDETGKKGLFRREKVNPGLEIGTKGREQLLCPEVDELEFKYWDDREEKWQDDWSTEGATSKGKLPQRVQIKMKALMRENESETFVTQTAIWLVDPILIK